MLLQQNKASFWPYLFIGTDMSFNDSENGRVFREYSISVMNQGVGPAIIEKVVVKMNGKEFLNWDDFFSCVLPDTFDYPRITRRSLTQKVLLPGDHVQILNLRHELGAANYLYNNNIFKDIEIAICYKSIYDEYWTVSCLNFSTYSPQNKRVKSDACQLEATTYFTD